VATALVTALLAALLTTALAATSTPARAAEGSSGAAGYTTQVIASTNDARVRNDRRTLRVNACLQRTASRQAERMATQRRISHTARFSAIGPRCGLRSWGENVAQALPDDHGRGVVRQWMGSSDHRANILRPGYRVIGAGAVRRHGSWWVVQIFGRR